MPRSRLPVWSAGLTDALAGFVRPEWRTSVLTAIKTIHTVIFATVGGAIALVVWDGLLQSPRQRTVVACGLVLVESAIYASNNQVCPLTPLAEQLGARRGSVADIFLPEWFSRRIPALGGSAMLLGLALNARASLRRRPERLTVKMFRRTSSGADHHARWSASPDRWASQTTPRAVVPAAQSTRMS